MNDKAVRRQREQSPSLWQWWRSGTHTRRQLLYPVLIWPRRSPLLSPIALDFNSPLVSSLVVCLPFLVVFFSLDDFVVTCVSMHINGKQCGLRPLLIHAIMAKVITVRCDA